MNITDEQIEEKMEKLPDRFRDLILSDDVDKAVSAIAQKYKIESEDKVDILMGLTTSLLIGTSNGTDFINEVKVELELNQETAEDIFVDVVAVILDPIMDYYYWRDLSGIGGTEGIELTDEEKKKIEKEVETKMALEPAESPLVKALLAEAEKMKERFEQFQGDNSAYIKTILAKPKEEFQRIFGLSAEDENNYGLFHSFIAEVKNIDRAIGDLRILLNEYEKIKTKASTKFGIPKDRLDSDHIHLTMKEEIRQKAVDLAAVKEGERLARSEYLLRRNDQNIKNKYLRASEERKKLEIELEKIQNLEDRIKNMREKLAMVGIKIQ